jgi:ABC-type branched-subunit amino acid transport system substrate-binding protein
MIRRARLALILCVTFSLPGQTPSTQDERGRQIYLHGKSTSKTAITATVGGDTRVNAAVLPCGNCHGADGRGRPESGIVPSNLTWDVLTKPYRLTNSAGRTRPPYDERLLRRAITMGIDSGGNTLSPAMPRYDLSLLDANDLIAYIRKLGTLADPGVSDDSIRLGVVLTVASGDPDSAKVVRTALEGFFTNVNDGGGVFGRRIDVEFLQPVANIESHAPAVRDFIEQQHLFAVLGDFSGYEAQLSAALRVSQAPAIAFAAAFPDVDADPRASLFYLDGGVMAEERELVRFARSHLGKDPQTAIVFASKDEIAQQAARRLVEELHAAGIASEVTASPSRVRSARVLFWLNREPAAARLAPPAAHATILVPDSLFAGRKLPVFPQATMYVAQNADSSSRTTDAPSRELWDRATTAAALFSEAVRGSGRSLTRATLVQSLEKLQDIRTNLAQPLSFGAGRHVGSTQVQMLQFDPADGTLHPVSE